MNQDLTEAHEWYLMSARQGHSVAQFDLGLMYRDGNGVKQNDEEALKWFLLSADQNYVPSQYSAALIYGNGGEHHDLVQSYKWLIIAENTAVRQNLNGMRKQAKKTIANAKKVLTAEQIRKSMELVKQWIEKSN